MSSTRWFERLERETRRESSKKTKHRVGKKFGTIFSKRSSAAGARFKETSFVQFFLNSDRSFVTFNWYESSTKKGFYQRYNWNLYQKTMKLSELQNTEDAFIIRPLKHIPYLFSNFQIYLIQSFTHVGFKVLLRQTSFDLILWMWRLSLLVTNMYFPTYHSELASKEILPAPLENLCTPHILLWFPLLVARVKLSQPKMHSIS